MSGIYVASKTKHAHIWKRYRDLDFPIVSTWIDEAGEGETTDLSDLWIRCIREASGPGLLLGSMWKDYAALETAWADRVRVVTLRMVPERITLDWLRS